MKAFGSFPRTFCRFVLRYGAIGATSLLFATWLPADELCTLSAPVRCVPYESASSSIGKPGEPYVRRSEESLSFGRFPVRDTGTAIRVRFVSLGARFSTATLQLDVETPAGIIPFAVSAKTAQQLVALHVPGDTSRITVSTERHVPSQLDVTKHRPGATWQVTLVRKPAMTGRIVDPNGIPIANAVVVTPDEKTVATTGPSGLVDVDWTESAPPFVTIHAPSYASVRSVVTQEGSDLSLGLVQLLRGGTLALEIKSDTPLGQIDIQVRRKQEDGPASHIVRRLKTEEAAASIDALHPGDYVVEIHGAEPLQRAAVEASIRDEETTSAVIAVRPTQLTIRARLGNAPVAVAPLQLTNSNFGWKADLVTDEDGAAHGELWQQGRYACGVRTPGKSVFVTSENVPEKDEHVWTIALPERTVVARVVDAATKRPVAGARLVLETRSPGRSTQVKGETNDQGEHTFSVVRAGTQTLTVTAERYVPSGPTHFTMSESDSSHEARVELRRGKQINVVTRYGNGSPAAGITALAFFDQEVQDHATTDSRGSATLTIPEHGSPLLLATTATGPFALRRLRQNHNASETIDLMLPSATGSLRLHVEDGDGKPMRGIAFLFRYDGEFIPPEVMPSPHPINATTAADGSAMLVLPVGTYEIWPYRAFNEAQAIIATSGHGVGKAAVSLVPGVHDTTFTLERR